MKKWSAILISFFLISSFKALSQNETDLFRYSKNHASGSARFESMAGSFGALGAVVASLVGAKGESIGIWLSSLTGYAFRNWQVAYIVGGFMGLLLLLMRVGTLESGFFHDVKQHAHIKKGDLKLIFLNKENLIKYLHCISIGIPVWYIIGLLVMNSKDDFGPWLGLDNVNNGQAVMYAYIGLSVGDLISGMLSQVFKSRKLVVFIYLIFSFILTVAFLFFGKGITIEGYYTYCFLLGAGTGYWAIFVTIAAEQFGTNIRSTAANTVPNFVRGSVNVIVLLFSILVGMSLSKGWAALIVGLIFTALALYSISRLKETFGKDLNYIEEIS